MSTDFRVATRPVIRWMLKEDLPTVLRIEEESFEFPWTKSDFLSCTHQPHCIAVVAEVQNQVVGYMIYEMAPHFFRVLTLAVDPAWRRKGIGRSLVERLINKLSPHRRHQILLEVRETNLVAQLFFRSLGFRACRILRNFYSDTVEDAYQMAYQIPQVPSCPTKNRIARYLA